MSAYHKHLEQIREVTYVAVPYAEYKKLIGHQHEVKKLQDQIHEHLKYRPIASARREEPSGIPEEAASVQPVEAKTGTGLSDPQAGSAVTSGETTATDRPSASTSLKSSIQDQGNHSTLLSPDLIKSVVSLVLQQLPAAASIGRGEIGSNSNNDLIPQLANNLPEVEIDPETGRSSTVDQPGEDSEGQEPGGLTDVDEQLIETVRAADKPKAKELLKRLKQFSDELHFNSDGSIFIGGELVQDSNIFDIFKFLFKPSPSMFHHHPYFKEVVNEIATLGFGYLLSRFYTFGLAPRGKNFIKNRLEKRKHIRNKATPWYHVGDE